MDDELLALLAEQADQIAKLTSERDELELKVPTGGEGPDYWSGVYDEIRAAWDAWALVELGTSSPSPLDLTGRPELARLWEAVR